MSSPEMGDNEDNDDSTDTPERFSNTADNRGSRFDHFGGGGGLFRPTPASAAAASPGRGEIPRLSHYSNAISKRVQKRRQRDRELGKRLRVDSDEDSDSKEKSSSSTGSGSGPRLSSFGDLFALLEAHPHVPSILSWWAQLVVNLSLFSLAVYVVFGFVAAIRSEFDHAAEERSDLILAEMAACAKNYVDNKCAGDRRLPALETVCENWERCMNRDPAKIGRAKVSAHTMAEIINNFIDPISWKAIVC